MNGIIYYLTFEDWLFHLVSTHMVSYISNWFLCIVESSAIP